MNTPSLDDAVSLLVQLEPGDAATLDELRGLLAALIDDPALSDHARALLAAAIHTADAGDDGLDELRRLVTAAAGAASPGDCAADAAGVGEEVDPSLMADFITESGECLDRAEAALLGLESDPDDIEAVNTVFRAFHTIKGTSAFLARERITSLAHHAESLLSRMRDREIQCVGHYAELALRSVDVLKALLAEIDTADAEPAPGYDELFALLLDPDGSAPEEITSAPPGPSGTPDARVMPSAAGAAPAPSATAADDRRAERHATGDRAEASIRVRTERLDQLIDMIGELVIAQSMVAQDETVRSGAVIELARKVSHAGKIVRDLQQLSMGMRMVPLKGPFQRVTRLARDLARKVGKRIEVHVDGEDTEIDRNLVDILTDPLVHMVRNAIDHGFELPDVRAAAGKPETGRLDITAHHAGGNVVVEITDDGRGLDRERILQKAVAQGLLAPSDAPSDHDVYELIFAPGFSTAERVTDISGRGVGMDVVCRNVEAMRGRIEIESRPGEGTRFVMRLPLTLAITDGMLVSVGGERYIVPTSHIQVSFRPDASALSTIVGRGEVALLRGDVLPLVRLHTVFGIEGAQRDPTRALLMVVGDGARRTALLVDELLGQYQVVAKALGRGVGRVHGVSGGAILGDGRVGLILDVHELVDMARGSAIAVESGAAGTSAAERSLVA